MSRVRVCPSADLPPGERTIVDAGGDEVGVFNVDGELYAVANACPHRGGPVCTGTVRGTLTAEWPGPGERVEERLADEPAIACPWHGWEFDLATGEHLGDGAYGLRTYDVVVEDGVVYVER